MLAIIVGLLAGLTGLLATAVMVVLSLVLGLYQSIAGLAVPAKPAWGSTRAEARSDRDAKVGELPEGRRDVEEPRLAA